MPTTIYLLRHAHTTPSPRYAPDFDWPLDVHGRRQAEQLVPFLSELAIDAVLSSSQKRMVETVKPFCDDAGALGHVPPERRLQATCCVLMP